MSPVNSLNITLCVGLCYCKHSRGGGVGRFVSNYSCYKKQTSRPNAAEVTVISVRPTSCYLMTLKPSIYVNEKQV